MSGPFFKRTVLPSAMARERMLQRIAPEAILRPLSNMTWQDQASIGLQAEKLRRARRALRSPE